MRPNADEFSIQCNIGLYISLVRLGMWPNSITWANIEHVGWCIIFLKRDMCNVFFINCKLINRPRKAAKKYANNISP